MKIILFYHEDTAVLGDNFKSSITGKWLGAEIEILRTIGSLKNRLRQYSDFFTNEVYIILVDSKTQLLELNNFSYLMDDKNLILVLQEESEEFMRLATLLYPRFITRISENYEDLHLVLQQMIKKKKPKKITR